MKHPSKGCGMPEKDESPAYEARNHSPQFLRKAVHLAEKKSGKRSPKKRG
jgi:hypothetical protein